MWLRVLLNLPLLIVVGAILVSIVWGDNSYIRRLGYQARIGELESEIKQFNDSASYYSRKADELNTDPESLEKIAREQYGMKRENEEVFITDIKWVNYKNIVKIHNHHTFICLQWIREPRFWA